MGNEAACSGIVGDKEQRSELGSKKGEHFDDWFYGQEKREVIVYPAYLESWSDFLVRI